MFKYLKYKLILFSVLLGTLFVTPANATKIFFVNGQYVFENVVPWKKFQADLKQHSQKVKDIVIKQETEVEKICAKI